MMNLRAATKTAATALKINLGRSLLTILGIVIGVFSIVLLVALGQGAQSLILSEIEGIGANTVVLRPGKQPDNPTDIAGSILSDSLKDRDIEALRKPINVPGAEFVDPALFIPGLVLYQDAIYRPQTFGWTPDAFERIFNIVPEDGSYFSHEDVRQRARVAVIGHKVKRELFGGSDAIGESIKIQGQNMRVVGVFPSKGQVSFFDLDDTVLIPYTTAQKTLLGIDFYHEIFISAYEDADVNQVADDVRATIRETHGITDPAKDDFFVTTQQEAVEIIGTVTQVLTVFLAAIASIALVVGGIGIMNIMLVSVTERTQEIGLRKAVGASNENILTQFLLEAVMLTLSGGVIGTVLAVGISGLVSVVAQSRFNLAWPFQLPVDAILLGVGVAIGVGILFGIYPARKAAKKDPIEALRYE
jgi:putative ABC transport system permease protein